MIRDDRRAPNGAISVKPEDKSLDGEEVERTASEQAVRVRQAPNGRHSRMRPQPVAIIPPATNLTQDSDSDEVMIKTDRNAAFLEWVRIFVCYI